MPEPILSDGQPITVRCLGIFELDEVPKPDSAPFTYEIETLGGQKVRVEFDVDAYDREGRDPPTKPDIPETQIAEKSAEWYQLRDYQIYQAALAHKHAQEEELLAYPDLIAQFILERTVDAADIPRIVTDDDWEAVYVNALVPELTKEKLAGTLRQTYQATWDDEEIFDALAKTAGGRGAVNAIRLWENQVMLQLRMTEVEYATLSLDERSRKVCAHMLPQWLEHLEVDLHRKEMEAKRNQKNG